ncbi:ATP-binding cassette domain-containing protein [Candidatus Bathyarchaeota archaeon]|nr:ATP-binding cassette domain-containing protein [Candidatus Bathyarchaeota archaeon]
MPWLGLDAEEYDRKYTDLVLLKRIWKYIPAYKKNMIAIIITIAINAMVVGLQPYLLTMLLGRIQAHGLDMEIVTFIAIIFLSNFISWCCGVINNINNSIVSNGVVRDLRQQVATSIFSLDMSFFDKHPAGKVISRLNADTQHVGETVNLTISFISNFFVITILIIPVMLVNVYMGIIYITLIPVIALSISWFRKEARRRTLLGHQAHATLHSFIQVHVDGIQIVKNFGLESSIKNKFDEVNLQSYHVNVKRALFLNIFWPMLEVIQGFLIILIVLGGKFSVQSGLITGTEFYLFIESMWSLWSPLFRLAAFWPQFQVGLAAIERVYSLLDAESNVTQDGAVHLDAMEGRIHIKDLTFQYSPGKPVFTDLCLNVAPGESIALVGHTGAGKSSIARLLLRLYEFQDGEINIDNVNIRDVDLHWYRKQVAFIPQAPFLWSDSIRHNVNYGVVRQDDDRLWWALEQAGGADWIRRLDGELETMIRENGKNISMGQRQLLMFARTLLQDPAILILDEATASVDPITETKIQEALHTLMKDRTSIIIAHRLWTIKHVDRIIVLDHGKIVEEGTHDSLLDQGGEYASLYETYFTHQSYEFIEGAKRFLENDENT